jgi:phage terminase small subunit
MPPLRNPRHELFALYMAKGMTKTAAHEAAGYRRNGANAAALASRLTIAKRVAELRQRAARHAVVTAARLIELAEEARLLAMGNNQASGAISAIKEMGVLSGVRVEKRSPGPAKPRRDDR